MHLRAAICDAQGSRPGRGGVAVAARLAEDHRALCRRQDPEQGNDEIPSVFVSLSIGAHLLGCESIPSEHHCELHLRDGLTRD